MQGVLSETCPNTHKMSGTGLTATKTRMLCQFTMDNNMA